MPFSIISDTRQSKATIAPSSTGAPVATANCEMAGEWLKEKTSTGSVSQMVPSDSPSGVTSRTAARFHCGIRYSDRKIRISTSG